VANRSLLETNPHLRDPAAYRKALITNVSSSTAIETGASVESIARTLLEETDRIKKPQRFAR
jgi:hypothetical protein